MFCTGIGKVFQGTELRHIQMHPFLFVDGESSIF